MASEANPGSEVFPTCQACMRRTGGGGLGILPVLFASYAATTRMIQHKMDNYVSQYNVYSLGRGGGEMGEG